MQAATIFRFFFCFLVYMKVGRPVIAGGCSLEKKDESDEMLVTLPIETVFNRFCFMICVRSDLALDLW